MAMIACGGEPVASAPFDGGRAMADIRAQCAFGPRIPGTEGHADCREWIGAQIEEVGLEVWEQPFEARLELIEKNADATNIWGVPSGAAEGSPGDAGGSGNAGDAEPLILLSAHWDTRPWADDEPDRRRRREPILGANDGGSGVAVALGIVRALKGTALEGRVALAFFDAEDSGVQNNDGSWCKGSQYAAANVPPWFGRVRLGINLDMVAGRGMKLSRELNSERAERAAVSRLWGIGLDLAPNIFTRRSIGPMIDDHLAFIEAGYPYIDLIGLPYAYWHRLGDRPEACDPVVMQQLANVLIEFIRQELKP